MMPTAKKTIVAAMIFALAALVALDDLRDMWSGFDSQVAPNDERSEYYVAPEQLRQRLLADVEPDELVPHPDEPR